MHVYTFTITMFFLNKPLCYPTTRQGTAKGQNPFPAVREGFPEEVISE